MTMFRFVANDGREAVDRTVAKAVSHVLCPVPALAEVEWLDSDVGLGRFGDVTTDDGEALGTVYEETGR